MDFTAFALVIAAAFMHAAWNLAAKRVSGNLAVFWLGLWLAGVVLVPFALASALQDFDPSGLPYVVATGLIHTVYFRLLAAAYRHGELSVVYPLARGTGVAGTGLVAWAVIGERVSVAGALGIISVCVGILLLGLRELRSPVRSRAYLLALLLGLTTAVYSVVDKLGVGRLRPEVYIAGLAVVPAVILAPHVLRHHRRELRKAWREQKGSCLFVGLGSMGTYLLILVAYQHANASYVVAARELSIAVVAVLSVAVLKEPLTVPKCLSVLAIVAGVLLVKVA
jgi:uncharacterized membrane protein